jgi:hypothetical protein
MTANDGSSVVQLNVRRVAVAMLLTPILPGFYAALFFAEPWALPVGLVASYPSEILFGLPILFVMSRKKWLLWWNFVLAGMLAALPAVLLYAWLGEIPHLEGFSVANALCALGLGGFSGLAFWLLGVSGDTPPTLRDILNMGPPG